MRLANPFRRPGVSPASWILMAMAAVGLTFLLVRLADVMLLMFASVLVGMLIHAIARPLWEKTPLGRTAALTAALGLVSAAAAGLVWMFGSQIAAQVSALAVLLPRAWHSLEARLSASLLGGSVLDPFRPENWPNTLVFSWLTRLASGAASAVAATVIVLAAGAYLAFHPETYANGALLLVPRRHRARAAEILEACGASLTRWLLGQLVSMIFIGVTTSIGLWLAGVPTPLALGLLAGVAQLVPVVGPWAAAIPGLVIAQTQGPETFGWAGVVYLITTQFEANFLTPLVLRRMAQLPMAVTLFAVIAMGVLLGPLGVVLATPLAIVAYVLVTKIYVEGVLGERFVTPEPDPLPQSR